MDPHNIKQYQELYVIYINGFIFHVFAYKLLILHRKKPAYEFQFFKHQFIEFKLKGNFDPSRKKNLRISYYVRS